MEIHSPGSWPRIHVGTGPPNIKRFLRLSRRFHLSIFGSQNRELRFSVHTLNANGFGIVSIYNTAVYDALGIQGEATTQESIFGGAILGSSTGKAITTGAPSSDPADWNSGYIWINDPQTGDFAITSTIPDSANSATLLALGIAALFLFPLVHIKRRRSE